MSAKIIRATCNCRLSRKRRRKTKSKCNCVAESQAAMPEPSDGEALGLPLLAESPTNHWGRPPARERGDSSKDGLYHGVGVSLSNWEFLETCFGWLFTQLVDSDSPAAARAYGAINSNNGRRDALEQAANVFFSLR